MFWFLFGVILFLLIRNNFNTQGVAKDVRRIVRAVRKTIKDAVRSARRVVKDNGKQAAGQEKAGPERETVADTVHAACAEQPAAQAEESAAYEPERNACMAAMLANVPTIDFPKNDPKYDSSRKYMYA